MYAFYCRVARPLGPEERDRAGGRCRPAPVGAGQLTFAPEERAGGGGRCPPAPGGAGQLTFPPGGETAAPGAVAAARWRAPSSGDRGTNATTRAPTTAMAPKK